MGAALFAACDKGEMKVAPGREGPPPQVVAASPSVDGTTVDFPANAPIRLRFDRFMRPDTIVRQSIRVTGGTIEPDGGASIAGDAFFEPTYDVLERVVTFTPSGNWIPGNLYSVTLWSPNDPLRAQDGSGFRALDGAPLASSVSFHFTAGAADPNVPSAPAKATACPSCSMGTLLPGARASVQTCGGSSCHEKTTDPDTGKVSWPQVGLDLSSDEGVVRTAIGHPAHQTLVGPDTNNAPTHPALFGVNMPLVDPGNPGNSYILYKLIYTDTNGAFACDPDAGTCLTTCTKDDDCYQATCNVALGRCESGLGWTDTKDLEPLGGAVAPSDEENARLRAFVQGTHMPIFSYQLSQAKRIQAWIAAGAPLCTDPTALALTPEDCKKATP